MAHKLYVGNLEWSITDEELGEFFSDYGVVVSAIVIKYRDTGKSKGFGFVQMETDEETMKVKKANGSSLKGRNIFISDAFPEEKHKNNKGEIRAIIDFVKSSYIGEEKIMPFEDQTVKIVKLSQEALKKPIL